MLFLDHSRDPCQACDTVAIRVEFRPEGHRQEMIAFLMGLMESVVAIGVLFLLAALDWIKSSSPDKCYKAAENIDDCYCERLHDGLIKQPSNTWSNLGFVVVGLIMLASFPAVVAGSGRDPLEERTFYAVLYGCIVIFLGPGSM